MGGGGGAAIAATRSGAASSAAGGTGIAARGPSRLTGNTARHTEQRARTPPSGTFAGSTRKIV
jgi:hypothetical protein